MQNDPLKWQEETSLHFYQTRQCIKTLVCKPQNSTQGKAFTKVWVLNK